MLKKSLITRPPVLFSRQWGNSTVEYTLLLILVAAVLFAPFEGTTLLDFILDAIRKMNTNYVRGLSYMTTLF